MTGDIFFDASGARSPWPEWMEAAGHKVVKPVIVDARLTYISVDLTSVGMAEKLLGSVESQRHPQAAVLTYLGNGVFRLTVFAYRADPPTEFADLISYVGEKVNPEFAKALKGAQQESKVRVYKNCQSQLYPIWQMPWWPKNFYIIGNSLCSPNPRFGQGITLAFIMAMLATEMILQGKGADVYAKKLKGRLNFSWMLASGADQDQIDFAENPDIRIPWFSAKAYFNRLQELMAVSPRIARDLFWVQNYLKNPGFLFADPRIWFEMIKFHRYHFYEESDAA